MDRDCRCHGSPWADGYVESRWLARDQDYNSDAGRNRRSWTLHDEAPSRPAGLLRENRPTEPSAPAVLPDRPAASWPTVLGLFEAATVDIGPDCARSESSGAVEAPGRSCHPRSTSSLVAPSRTMSSGWRGTLQRRDHAHRERGTSAAIPWLPRERPCALHDTMHGDGDPSLMGYERAQTRWRTNDTRTGLPRYRS